MVQYVCVSRRVIVHADMVAPCVAVAPASLMFLSPNSIVVKRERAVLTLTMTPANAYTVV